MKLTLVFAAALLSLSAHATPGGEPVNTGCNGKGNPNSPCAGTPKPVKAAPVVNVTVSNTVKAVARAPRGSAAASSAAPASVAAAPATAPAPYEGSQTFVGGSVYERSAPPVAVGAPSQPLTSCRLVFSLGGSNTGGGIAAGVPLGSDQTCLVGAKLAVMERVGGFSADERVQVACEIEGMEKLATCKRIAEKAPQVARVEPLLP